MRCDDLPRTWQELHDWFADAGVLVLPRLEFTGPGTRLDADVDPARPATPDELAMVLARLRAVVSHLGARVAYVGQVDDRRLAPGAEPEVAAVTIRIVAGGVVHELALIATWYAALTEAAPVYTHPAA